MLDKLRSGRQKYGFYKYVTREATNHVNRVFFKSDRSAIVKALAAVGVKGDMTVCVHASLSKLGYIPGGAATIVDALFDVLAKDGCIAMPAFSMAGSMAGYIDDGNVFDVRSTPSQVGAIGETFRRRDGVLRSLHPTNSVAAFGSGAAELLRDHDQSRTPYGADTPYGRLVENENAYVLMLNTHVQSLLHHIQERVSFPNLFLDGEREVAMVDQCGEARSMITKVMRPRLPYYVAVPSGSGEAPNWALLHDFALMFNSRRAKQIAEHGYRFDGYRRLYERRKRFIADGILRAGKLGRGEIGLLNVGRFVRAIQPEFEESIAKFGRYYDLRGLETVAQLPMI
jgi:aminoglycoside N3'-acetyltransferase